MSNHKSKRPNIVCILTDDQGAWALGCYGNSELKTPNIDRLAEEGVRFTNFFCVSPVCSPARASLLTGRIPSQHGIHDWIREGNCGPDGKDYLRGLDAYTEYLQRAGYACGISGKWHMGNSDIPQKGFSHWYVHQKGGGEYNDAPMIRDGYPVVEKGYISDLITDDAINFIERHASDENPFYLSLHFTAPHSPWINQHPEEFVSLYDDCPFNSCPREAPHPWNLFVKVPDAIPQSIWENPSEHLKGYYGAISAMDWNVGRVMGQLDRLGLKEDTLVFFLSDNGFNCGHHGIWGKGNGTYPQNMYDTSVKVPAIFCHPGSIPPNIVSDAMLSGYDLMPTLLDYLGIPYDGSGKPGKSFAEVLTYPVSAEERHDEVVVYDEYGPVRMIRDRNWKYVHRYPDGPNELYHLESDPDERENLVNDGTCSDLITAMRSRMEDWFHQYVDPDRDGSLLPVTGKGQLAPVGKLGEGLEAFYSCEE